MGGGRPGPEVLSKLDGLEVSRDGRLVVTETLQTTRDPNIFAMGDCAYLVPKGAAAPIPPRAQAAHQEASHLYTELQRRMRGEPLRPFHYRDFGSLVSLGDIDGRRPDGLRAWAARCSSRGCSRASCTARSTRCTRWRSRAVEGVPRHAARSLRGRTEPVVKLH